MLAFLDLEGHQEALAFRVVFGQRRHHLHVGIAVLEIKAANQIPIGLDPVRIIDVGAAEEAQEIRFARLDDVAQAIRRISNVADEFDRLDAGFPTLDDGENQIDAVVGLLDDFRRHAYVVAACMAVDFDDALGIGLHHRARERTARLGLDLSR